MFRREETGFMPYVGGIAAFFVFAALAWWLPDIDVYRTPLQWIGLLRHRSLLTHGLLLPLALYLAVLRKADHKPSLAFRLGTIGFLAATALHLCFDLFPYSWRGFALIHLPFMGYTSSLFSQIWLFASAAIILWLCFRLLRNLHELSLLAVGIGLIYLYGATQEPRLVFLPSLALVPAMLIGFVLPRPARTVVE